MAERRHLAWMRWHMGGCAVSYRTTLEIWRSHVPALLHCHLVAIVTASSISFSNFHIVYIFLQRSGLSKGAHFTELRSYPSFAELTVELFQT
ncbi:uncharacterized protein BDV17DRAFT_179679 [Aspergillus undulatus]|uniref:uncharacterized protein n=1 Tax=Aspergillus undulatus TaxID=1810928 RepID=UPI003CCD8A6E